MNPPLVDAIDAELPQTQCTRCGFSGCRPYAEAIVRGEADIDQCPPGGQAGVNALAALLGRTTKPLNPAFGLEAPASVALIDEVVCIGCTKCIQACPVDAILGAAKRMHSIIDAECTGCELCIPGCPVDCIAMRPISEQPLQRNAVMARATQALQRFEARSRRLERLQSERKSRTAAANRPGTEGSPPISRNAVLEAIARGKAKRAATKQTPGA